MSETTYVQRDGRVLRCVIATGARGGTLDSEGLDQTREALGALDGVGAVLLASEGESFCTGGDVRGFAAADDPAAYVRRQADFFHDFLLTLAEAPVPVVAGVQGWAAGAGMSIACSCDVLVAGPSTRFRPAYPGIGFSPDGGMSWTLPRIVGTARARHILLTDRVLTGQDALDFGLVAVLVDDEEIAGEALRTAHRIADGPTAALGRVKRLLADSGARDLAAQLAAEADGIAASAGGPEGREGVRAFAERRPPRFHP